MCARSHLRIGCAAPNSIYTLCPRVSGSNHTSCWDGSTSSVSGIVLPPTRSFPVSSMKYEDVFSIAPRRFYARVNIHDVEYEGGGALTRINRAAKWIRRRTAGSVTRRRVSKHRGGCRQSGRYIKGRRVNGQLGSTFSPRLLLPKELAGLRRGGR